MGAGGKSNRAERKTRKYLWGNVSISKRHFRIVFEGNSSRLFHEPSWLRKNQSSPDQNILTGPGKQLS